MAKRYTPKWDEDSFLAELNNASDRAVIAVGGAYVEYALEEAILSRLRIPATETENNIFFHDKGIIGSFFEKIWMAYFLKIVGSQTRRDLDLIRSIRNEAAHDMNPISFNTEVIANRCRELLFAKESIAAKRAPDLRGMFTVSIQFYTANLLLRAGDGDAEIADAISWLAPYLDR